MYDKATTDPMKLELTSAGVKDLATAQDVHDFMKSAKSERGVVILVNSVCGCAAGSARPGLIQSLEHAVVPSGVGTVFAGVDREATETARSYFAGYVPSSPAMGFFREGELVYMLERHNIEGTDATSLAKVLASIYDKFFQEEIDDDAMIYDPNWVEEMEVKNLKEELEAGSISLLDCRSEGEREVAVINPSELLDQALAEKIVQEWSRDKKIAIYCHHGHRSKQAVQFFKQYDFSQIYSVKGGIHSWSEEIDSSVKQY